jgi:hypothetical protein
MIARIADSLKQRRSNGEAEYGWTRSTIAGMFKTRNEIVFSRLLCLLRGHHWGPPGGDASGAFRVCTRCGKRKFLSGGQPRNMGYPKY